MIEEFFGFHLKCTIRQILSKLKCYKNNFTTPIDNAKNVSALVWNQTMFPIYPNVFTAWICPFVWRIINI